MADARPLVLLADFANPWRAAVSNFLEREHCGLRVTDSGEELLAALTDMSELPKLIIVGQALTGMGGLEALYQSSRLPAKREAVVWPQRAVMLISDSRSDIELLDLLRARGVTGFLYRDDPLEKTMLKIKQNLKGDRRPAERHVIRLDAKVKIGEKAYEGAMFDLSLTGAQVICSPRDLVEAPSIGDWIDLDFGYGDVRVACRGEVCRLSRHKSIFGSGILLGIEFENLDDRRRESLAQALKSAIEEIEEARRG